MEKISRARSAFVSLQHDERGEVPDEGTNYARAEIGDAPQSVQVSLLRALETRRIKPVGADREQCVDVRLTAATSRDLRALVREERFRADRELKNALYRAVTLSPPQYQRVFGERWAVSEDGRGLRALMQAVGLDVQSEEARERVRRGVG